MLLFAEDGGQQRCQSLFAGTTCDVVSEGKHEEEGCQLLDGIKVRVWYKFYLRALPYA